MSEQQAVDRNWNELLQELRVTQTGLQILTGFLVSIPFQQRFTELTDRQRTIYMVALAVALVATMLVLAPASFHRLLFRQQEKEWLIQAGNTCARAGLELSGVAITAVAWLLFDVVLGEAQGVVAAVVATFGFVLVWWVVPFTAHRHATLARTPRSSPRA